MHRAGELDAKVVAKEPRERVVDIDARALMFSRTDDVDQIGIHRRRCPLTGLSQAGTVQEIEFLVRVQNQDPLAARRRQRAVARGGEVILPGMVDDTCPGRQRQFPGTVGRPGIDQHDLVHKVGEHRQGTGDVALLIARNHGDRDERSPTRHCTDWVHATRLSAPGNSSAAVSPGPSFSASTAVTSARLLRTSSCSGARSAAFSRMR